MASVEEDTYETIIIGAGWSGLGAAKTLQENGVSNFLVVDAHDYIGGRSKTTEIYDGAFMEEGSTFLNGIGDNMIYDLVVEYGINKTPYNFYDFEVWTDGVISPGGGGEMFMERYSGLYKSWEKQYYNNQLDFDSSLQTVIENYITELGIQNNPQELAVLDGVVEMSVNYSYAADPSKFASYAGNFDWEMLGGHAVLNEGFGGVVERYSESLLQNIKLNSKVTKINYDVSPVEVTYIDTTSDRNNESVIRANKVLSTIPIGVLQAGIVEFVPPFSDSTNGEAGIRKQAAIDIMNPGSYEKVALFWQDMTEDEIFWNMDIEHIIHIEDHGSDKQGNFTYWNNFYFVNKIPMLYTLAAGEYAENIQTMSDEDVIAQAVERLRTHYGEEKVPDPSHYRITRWKSDDTTRTIYCYAEVGADADTREHLAEPLQNRLYFAGEATYEKRGGSAQGALYSGIKAAYYILGMGWKAKVWEFFHYYFPLTSEYCRRAYQKSTVPVVINPSVISKYLVDYIVFLWFSGDHLVL